MAKQGPYYKQFEMHPITFIQRNRTIVYTLFVIIISICGCKQQMTDSHNRGEVVYTRHVGDILFDANVDDPAFKVCDEGRAKQYYNFGKGLLYKGEKDDLDAYFMERFKPKKKTKETGSITIRFIVNCEGKTGRFRIQGIDPNYKVKQFNTSLVNQLLQLTKELDGWVVGEKEGKIYDYYQYLTFKIKNGELIEIMP